jgi:large subunit ribosomal protein L29
MSKAGKYHDMTTEELKEKHISLKNELFNLRFQHTTGQLKNPLMLRTVKKDIAIVLTILRERELGVVKNEGKKRGGKK